MTLYSLGLVSKQLSRFSLMFVLVSLLSACSFMLPSPDVLHENLTVPLGRIDGSRRYFQLLDVQQLPGNYEKQEHFEADFRGNDVELLVNWEKSGNSLTLVASATAGQPVFAVRQEGRQLVEQHSYFELKGLKFSWLLADYQFVHLPLETLNQALMIESAGVVELACIENCSAPETAFTLLKTRYLLAQSAIDGGNLDAAQMTVRYYADSAALNSADVSRIQVENTRWGYHYVVNVL